jgi:hypothetical protein
LWRTLLENAQRDGYLEPEIDCDALERSLMHSFNGVMLSWVMGAIDASQMLPAAGYAYSLLLQGAATKSGHERLARKITSYQKLLKRDRLRAAAECGRSPPLRLRPSRYLAAQVSDEPRPGCWHDPPDAEWPALWGKRYVRSAFRFRLQSHLSNAFSGWLLDRKPDLSALRHNLTITVEGSYAVQAGTHVRASARNSSGLGGPR